MSNKERQKQIFKEVIRDNKIWCPECKKWVGVFISYQGESGYLVECADCGTVLDEN